MRFRVTKLAPYAIALSLLIILAGVIVGILNGMRLGIDFTGGTLLVLNIGEPFDNARIEEIVRVHVSADFQVAASDEVKALIRMQDRDLNAEELNEVRDKIIDDIRDVYPKTQIETIDRVGAVAGRELMRNAFLSVAVACAFMLIYIWIRFELLSGFAALVALLHDVAIMVSAMIILRQQVNTSFIAAVLTIVGYSINDTIVVFDRIRENQKRYSREMSREEIVDRSVAETLTRTLNTSLTTFFTITAVYILGVPSIREFTLPIIVGIVSGTFSSIFIASPLWVYCHRFIEKRRQIRKAAARQKA
ncbi:MAG: protein translocase subunit SecF [Clostridiales bacterium]|nr:protein translocase subunit SecF [Clostridiales bacterium]